MFGAGRKRGPPLSSGPLQSGLLGEGVLDLCPTSFLLAQEPPLLPHCPRRLVCAAAAYFPLSVSCCSCCLKIQLPQTDPKLPRGQGASLFSSVSVAHAAREFLAPSSELADAS